jgi:hypothetical protein
MKPIPGTLQEGGASFQTTHWTLILSAQKSEQNAKASFVDGSEYIGRDFDFTGGRKKDSNETAANEEFNKMKSRIGTRDHLVAAACGQSAAGRRAGKAKM